MSGPGADRATVMRTSTPSGRSILTAALLILGLGACAEPQADDAPAAVLGHVHGLGLNPGDGRLHVATHNGLFVLEGRELRHVGENTHDLMGFGVVGEDRFVASGHPVGGSLPEPMGLVQSTDAGATWEQVSLGGEADLHSLDVDGDTIAAHDSVGGRILISADGGQTFDTLAEMDALDVLLLDSETILVAGVDGVLTRLDADGSQSLSEAPGLVNVDRAALGYVGVGPDGQVWTSTDGDARTWTTRGRLDGMPAALETGEDRWYAATSTGIHASDDQGVSWERIS